VNQLAICQRVRELAARQLAAVEADDLDIFGALSAEREALVARLTAPADPRARALAGRLLREALELDQRIQHALRSGLQATRSELAQLRQGHRAVRAYAPRAATQGIGGRA